MTRTIRTVSMLLLLLVVCARAQDAKPDFSGTWTLDLSKSDFGMAPPPVSIVQVIEQKGPNIKVTSTQKLTQGELVNERTFTTDGKEATNKLKTLAGEQEVTSTSQWNGRKLATVMKLEVQGAPITLNDSWDLSDDGKVMTVVREIKTAQGDFTQKTVYNKQ